MIDVSLILVILIQYSQRHTMINHCDRRITHLSDTDTVQSDTDISFVLFNISFVFRVLPSLLSPTDAQESK